MGGTKRNRDLLLCELLARARATYRLNLCGEKEEIVQKSAMLEGMRLCFAIGRFCPGTAVEGFFHMNGKFFQL